MAIATFNKKIFEKEIGKLTNEMQEKISMFGTPVEEINEKEIQVEIFPNRPDLLSYHGFKRSFLSFLGKKTGLKKYEIHNPEKNYKVIIDSSVEEIRPLTTCAIVRGLKLNDERIKEIIEIQEKLHLTVGRKRKKLAMGVYPLDEISLPITFKAVEPDKIKFTPLESNREMSGLEILQKHPAGKEYAHLLTGKIKFPIFVDSKDQILSMPPIINSETVGRITQKTRDVFIECSGFDLELLKKTLNIIVTTLADMGGKIYAMKLNYGKTPDLTPEKMKISLEDTNKLLGLNLTENDLEKLIKKMGYDYKKKSVLVPAWRIDVLHEVDLIEDIAIAYGYENFIPEIPKISTIGSQDPKEIIKKKFAEILVGLKLIEVSNYHLTNKKDQFSKMCIPQKQEKNFVELEDSKTDYTILRKNLAHYLLKNLSENIDSEYPQKIFEIGKVFELHDEIEEKENLAIAIAPGNFTEIKQIVEYFFKMIDMDIKFDELNGSSQLINGRVSKIILNEKEIGYFGEIHPKILSNWKIKMPVAILEINLEEVFQI